MTWSLLVPNPLTAGLLVREGGVGIFNPNLADMSSATLTLLDKVGFVKFNVVTGLANEDTTEDGRELATACWAATARMAASIWAAASAATGLLKLNRLWCKAMAPRELWN